MLLSGSRQTLDMPNNMEGFTSIALNHLNHVHDDL